MVARGSKRCACARRWFPPMWLVNSSVASTAMLKVPNTSSSSSSELLSPVLISVRLSANVHGVILICCMYKIHGRVISASTIVDHGHPMRGGASCLVRRRLAAARLQP